ncbi:MAG: hypothetical protein RJB56_1057 [Actinomycetota bacterium]|jgi:acetyl esterase/lipase
MSPVDPLFAEKFDLFKKLPADAGEMDWMGLIGAEYNEPLSEYVSPALGIEHRTIPGPQGEIPVRIYRPENLDDKAPGLVWFHGGAFMFGDLDMNEAEIASRELAHRAKAVVMSVDYRLVTPERKFPTGQIDGLAAAQWFRDNASALGVDANRITVSGASAGACLTASVMLQLRDRNELSGFRSILVYPIVHEVLPELSQELSEKLAEIPSQLVFNPPFMEWLNVQLAPAQADPSFYCYPGDFDNLGGLTETLIINSEYDSLRASGEQYFNQLVAAGVETKQLTAEGALHGHLNWLPADCKSMDWTLEQMVTFITK